MFIKKIILKNFGLYKGIHTIDFLNNNPSKNVTLIGGLNGRGKTTLLDAITLGLYGRRALKYLQDERIKYSEYLLNRINKSAMDKETSITITLCDVNEAQDEIVIGRLWRDMGKGELSDSILASRNGLEDQYLSQNWDYYMEEILPLSISRFFFFDNEKISQIADDESFDSLKEAIKSLLGLTTIEQLINDMQKMIRRKSMTNKTAEQTGIMEKLSDVQKSIDECNQQIKDSLFEAARSKTAISQARKKLSEAESEFWSLGGNLGLQREMIQTKRDELRLEHNAKIGMIIDFLENPKTPLLLCGSLLTSTYNRAQQDEQVRMANYSNKVIDRMAELLPEMNHNEHNRIIILEYLSQTKLLLGTYMGESRFEFTSTSELLLQNLVTFASDTTTEIQQFIRDLAVLEQELLQLDLHLSFEVNETDIRLIWDKLQALTAQNIELETRVSLEVEKQDQLQHRLEILENKRSQLLKVNLLDQQTHDYDARALRYCSMTIDVMVEFSKRLQIKRIKELELKIFDCFRFIAQKHSIIQRIDINPETLKIRLIDYTGGELMKTQLSAGEKQIFAISILWGLAQCSGYQMPVIVDTPLGRLDSNHRANFLKRYLPHASKQVVVLSTDEEINGKYYDMIKPYTNDVYTLIYNEEEKSSSIIHGYFGGDAN